MLKGLGPSESHPASTENLSSVLASTRLLRVVRWTSGKRQLQHQTPIWGIQGTDTLTANICPQVVPLALAQQACKFTHNFKISNYLDSIKANHRLSFYTRHVF